MGVEAAPERSAASIAPCSAQLPGGGRIPRGMTGQASASESTGLRSGPVGVASQLVIYCLLNEPGRDLARRRPGGRWGASRSAPQPNKGQARKLQDMMDPCNLRSGWGALGRRQGTQSLCSLQGGEEGLAESGELRAGGGGQQAAAGTGLDWKRWGVCVLIPFSPQKKFPGLPSGKNAAQFLLPCPSQSPDQ